MRRHRQGLGPMALVALTAVAMGGCGRSGSPVAQPTSTPSSPVVTSSAPEATASPYAVRPCTSGQLRFQLWRTLQPTMQQPADFFAFTNTSSVDCTLEGYPGLQLRDTGGRLIDFGPVLHGSSYLIDDPGAHLVRLRPGGRAFFGFGWVDVNQSTGGTAQGCRDAGSVRVTLPGTGEAMTAVAALSSVCPGSTPTRSGQNVTAVALAQAWAGHATEPGAARP